MSDFPKPMARCCFLSVLSAFLSAFVLMLGPSVALYADATSAARLVIQGGLQPDGFGCCPEGHRRYDGL